MTLTTLTQAHVSNHSTTYPDNLSGVMYLNSSSLTTTLTLEAVINTTTTPAPQGDGLCGLPTRLAVGDVAFATETNAINIGPYQTPDSLISIINTDDSVIVISGPVCNNGLTWLLVEYNFSTGWAIESHGGGYMLDTTPPPTPTMTPEPTVMPTPGANPILFTNARELAWSRDGTRIAVIDEIGIAIFTQQEDGEWLTTPHYIPMGRPQPQDIVAFTDDTWIVTDYQMIYMLNDTTDELTHTYRAAPFRTAYNRWSNRHEPVSL